MPRKHLAVSHFLAEPQAALFGRLDLRRCAAGSSFVRDDLLQALDAVPGEGNLRRVDDAGSSGGVAPKGAVRGATIEPLESVESGCGAVVLGPGDMKARYVDGASEIVPAAEGVVAGMGDDLVKKRLPGREVRIAGQRQQQPIGRVDKGRFFQASRVEAVVALCRRNAPSVKFGGSDAEPRQHRLAVRFGKAGDIFGDPSTAAPFRMP